MDRDLFRIIFLFLGVWEAPRTLLDLPPNKNNVYGGVSEAPRTLMGRSWIIQQKVKTLLNFGCHVRVSAH